MCFPCVNAGRTREEKKCTLATTSVTVVKGVVVLTRCVLTVSPTYSRRSFNCAKYTLSPREDSIQIVAQAGMSQGAC